VIRLGVRLTFGGGRDALVRLAVISAAVAIGVTLLLTAIAGVNAVHSQNQRYAWLETGLAPDSFADAPVTTGDGSVQSDPLWWASAYDYFDNTDIGRIDVAGTGPNSPIPPGIDRLPEAGEFFASPAMAELIESVPARELADRYPGRQVGTIGDDALPDPDILLIVIGHDPDELSQQPRAQQVTNISATSPNDCDQCNAGIGINNNGIILILTVAGAALIFPVMIFIGAATRLSAARREERFAAMRLTGATPRQITVLASVESAIAALFGTFAGFAFFYALRPAIASIPFTGARFFPDDLALGGLQIAVVIVAVPVGAALAARVALRRVQISPLGVTRRTTPAPPRAWRLIPLVAGIAELACLAIAGPPDTSGAQAAVYLLGVLLIMAGLVIAGPWLTMVSARVLAGRTGRLAGLIAGRRLSDNPHAGFRAISGLVLALFIGSGAIGTITTVVASKDAGTESGALVQWFHSPLDQRPTAVTTATTDELDAVDGVTGIAVIRTTGNTDGPEPHWLTSCSDLAAAPLLGRCPAGAEVANVRPHFGTAVVNEVVSNADTVWPASNLTAADLDNLPIEIIVVDNDGSTSAIEQARTILENASSDRFAPQTIGEINLHGIGTLAQYQRLANVVIIASLIIAVCSLAVSVAGSLTERKRPFSLLRLTGVPLTVLRRVVTLESAVPLILAALIAAAGGFLAAQLFLQAQMNQNVQAPGVAYYAVVLAGLAVSLAVIASTFPLLNRITGPESARND